MRSGSTEVYVHVDGFSVSLSLSRSPSRLGSWVHHAEEPQRGRNKTIQHVCIEIKIKNTVSTNVLDCFVHGSHYVYNF